MKLYKWTLVVIISFNVGISIHQENWFAFLGWLTALIIYGGWQLVDTLDQEIQNLIKEKESLEAKHRQENKNHHSSNN